MKFDDFDASMRKFETDNDYCVPLNMHIVVRLDGRSFTRYTKEVWNFEAPFDVRFRDLMLETTEHLMDCGFGIVYGYTESDEISLLLRFNDLSYSRKTRKIISILAGEASARFSLSLGSIASFDARICELPTANHVVDYFRWRHEDAHRNALNAHCYWMLRAQGLSANDAGERLRHLSPENKNTFLNLHGINFDTVPAWQKRGMGLYWETYLKPAINAKTGEAVAATRRRLKTELQLPAGSEYGDWVKQIIAL